MQLTVIALTRYLTPHRTHHTPKPPRKGRYPPPAETRQGPRRHIDAVAARRHAHQRQVRTRATSSPPRRSRDPAGLDERLSTGRGMALSRIRTCGRGGVRMASALTPRRQRTQIATNGYQQAASLSTRRVNAAPTIRQKMRSAQHTVGRTSQFSRATTKHGPVMPWVGIRHICLATVRSRGDVELERTLGILNEGEIQRIHCAPDLDCTTLDNKVSFFVQFRQRHIDDSPFDVREAIGIGYFECLPKIIKGDQQSPTITLAHQEFKQAPGVDRLQSTRKFQLVRNEPALQHEDMRCQVR